MIFRARQFEFNFPRPVIVMGVVNVTPDSFSDGGRYLDPAAAVHHGLQLVSEGAEIIDVGGESTRPKATPVSEQEERRRVLPVIEALVSEVRVPISVDTMKPGVARAALQAGASIVNDVAAHRSDPEMWEAVAAAGAGYVLMHMQGTPQTMQRQPVYNDVVKEVGDFFSEHLARTAAAGLSREQVILDVGIGFGKTVEHNLRLLAALRSFTKWGCPLLVGVSRKSFLGRLDGGPEPKPVEARLPGALACAAWAAFAGVNMVRTHDVTATLQALRMTEAILAQSDHVISHIPNETK